MNELSQIVGAENSSVRLIDRLAFARDASLYRLVPEIVIRPATSAHVRDVMAWCVANKRHLTFRTAGTSLSGQAVTDGVMVDLTRHWKACKVLEEGARVRVQPGVTGGRVNAMLRPHARKLGPDPASLTACMIGGVVANNASGMCCGTSMNSYHTIESMVYMLTDGTRVDTASDACDSALAEANRRVYEGIALLRDEIRSDDELCERIRRKYRIKNTIGYSLNAFLDEVEPARILGRLMIGSEGTLGFIEEVMFRTVPDARYKLTALIIFSSIDAACEQIEELRNAGAAAVELMDDASLLSFATLNTTPEEYCIDVPGAAALLVEFHATSIEESAEQQCWADAWVLGLDVLRPVVWTHDASIQATLWHLRKGLMPTLGAMRPSGTTMINEDVAVPVHRLPQLVRDVRKACIAHGYHDAIIFGHAKDGNIHFVVNQKFVTTEDVQRYKLFMDEIARIVVTVHDGSLKAEHGTGRNMAPFVEMEWGEIATGVMRRLKQLVDPHGILNPGVILSDNPTIHLENIKRVPEVNAIVDKCIECGFCEHVCPSRNITLTPRQRIGILRELHGGLSARDRKEVLADYQYDSIDTCAADGMCEAVCPVSINTGTLVKQWRTNHTSFAARAVARISSASYGTTNAVMRIAAPLLLTLTKKSNALHWKSAQPLQGNGDVEAPMFLYSPGCGSRWLGKPPGEHSVVDAVLTLAERAGIRMTVANNANAHCCGQIYDSRGLVEAAQEVCIKSLNSDRGNALIPWVVDSSTCAHTYKQHAKDGRSIIDLVTFLTDTVLPNVPISKRFEHVVLHPGCGAQHLGVDASVRDLASLCAKKVTVPTSAGCCGMAGDRGLRYPELIASAILDEASEIAQLTNVDGWFSMNTTCELALSEQTGQSFRSIAVMVEHATR
ncbi:MAG: FAD-binding and (Fe-S)-binding domain-containing protein [bacterium]|nr:FAD-binding and (Fe-S)-binding domain-containing protein [bacterium]